MIERQLKSVRRFLRATEGVSALEYALLVGIITVGIGAALATFSTDLQNTIENIGDDVVTRGNLVTSTTTPTPPTP